MSDRDLFDAVARKTGEDAHQRGWVFAGLGGEYFRRSWLGVPAIRR